MSEAVQSRPKRQHWVPQFYLKYFATPESAGADSPQVWIHWKSEDRSAHKIGIKKVATEGYLYSPKSPDGERNFAVEEKLSSLEGLMARRWNDLANRYIDLVHDTMLKKMLALFIAVQFLRTPVQLRQTKNVHARIVAKLKELENAEGVIPEVSVVDTSGQKQVLDPDSWQVFRDADANALQELFVTGVFDVAFPLVDELLSRRWAIIASKEDVFVTSDVPAILHHPERSRAGIRTLGSVVLFPLSPKRLLLLHDSPGLPSDGYGEVLHPFVHQWHNSLQFQHCDRYIISCNDPEPMLEELAAESLEEQARLRSWSAFPPPKNSKCPCGSRLKWKRCHGAGM